MILHRFQFYFLFKNENDSQELKETVKNSEIYWKDESHMIIYAENEVIEKIKASTYFIAEWEPEPDGYVCS